MPRNPITTVFDTMPDQIKDALSEAILSDPLIDVPKWAESQGLPPRTILRLANNPRFIMGVARRCSDKLARSTLPKAVAVLEQALSDPSVPWGARLDAARMVFTSAKPYLDGHLDREKAQDELENMSVSQLEAMVRRFEQGLRDITPSDDAETDPDAISNDAFSVINS